VYSASPRPGVHVSYALLNGARIRWAPVAQGHEPLVGAHDPSPRGRLEVPRHPSEITPHHKRFSTRDDFAVKLDALTAARTGMMLSCALPPRHSRTADRPVIANCPARGPPRTA